MLIRSEPFLHVLQYLFIRSINPDIKYLFLLSAVKSKYTVPRDGLKRLRICIIIIINGAFLCLLLSLGRGNYTALTESLAAYPFTKLCAVGQSLGNYILGTRYCGLNIRNFIVSRNILGSLDSNRILAISLEYVYSKRFKSAFPRYHASGAALWLIRAVDILKPYCGFCLLDLLAKLSSKLALLLYGRENGSLTFLKIPEIAQSFIKTPQHIIMHCPGGFLTVTCNKRDGISFINKPDDSLCLPCLNLKLCTYLLNYIHINIICSCS